MLNAVKTIETDDYLVPFRLSPDDLQQVAKRAKQAGLSINEWVSSAVTFCLSKQPSQPVLSQPETSAVSTQSLTIDDDEENPF